MRIARSQALAITVALAAAVAAAVAAAPHGASAQCPPLRRGERGPVPPSLQAPRVLVPIFRGDPDVALTLAGFMRDRLRVLFDPRQLWVITCYDQDTVMVKSGYPADAALAKLGDFQALGRMTNATESIDGDIMKGADGQYHVSARLYYQNNVNLHEPLEVSGKDVEGLANRLVDLYKAARLELEPYAKCDNLGRDRKGDSALAYAKRARAVYPAGQLWRVCLMNALSVSANAPPDSIIAAAMDVLATDSVNRRAVGLVADAEWAKGDTATAVSWYVRFYDLDRSNEREAQAVISRIAQTGAPDRALPIIDEQLKRNPADETLHDTQLRIQLRLHHYKQAYVAFEDLIKADTAQATLANYTVMIGAAQLDSNPQMVLQYLARVTQKCPDNAGMWMNYSVHLKDVGQLQQALVAARRAVAADPKVPSGYAWLFQLYADLNEPDSTLGFARVALAGGADSVVVDNAILRVLAPAFSTAQTDTSGAGWAPALALSLRVDSIHSSESTKYYIGVASFSLAQAEMTPIRTLASTDRPKACAALESVFELANESYDAMVTGRGGRKDPAHAQIILQAVPQIRTWVASTKTAISTGGFSCR